MKTRPAVGVLLGGTSPEREVSLSSGEGISAALEEAGWRVLPYDYGSEGEAAHGPVAHRLLHALREGGLAGVGVVFNALHGGAGEDGRIQSVLELAGMPYTGSGVLASALTMDKWLTKSVVRRVGVPVPPGRLWWKGEPAPSSVVEGEWGAELGWPLVVKPVDQGSTVGFSLVEEPAGMPEALERATAYGDRALIEEYIPGREMTVAVMEGRALPVVEIHPLHGVYDYDCKYTSGMSEYTCPADLSPELTVRLQESALRAYAELLHRDCSRMDYRMTEGGEFYLLEGNTLPGFTATSLVPKAAAAAGLSFTELCDRLVRAALERGGRVQ